MNPFEMVVLIVAIVTIASMFKARHVRNRERADDAIMEDIESERLRDEVKALKERVAVLERIATDRSSLLDQEIEGLRDR